MVVAETRAQAGPGDNGLAMPDGGSIADWDTNPTYFYCDAAGNTQVSVLNDTVDVPEYVQTYAGTLHTLPVTESGTVIVTVKDEAGTAVTDATLTASGLYFTNNGDGTYSAKASLGSEYQIKVSKEGFSNVIITSDVLNNDGDVFNATATLVVDTDGYAVVKLTGGSDNAAVTGATVTLSDGTVLKDNGDGTYQSEEQMSLGEKTVTITNTGDYVAPTTAQTIVVKTTDEATEIHLDKIQGAVSVTLEAQEGETETLNASAAKVTVGTTELSYAGNGVFTGKVDISTAYDVSVSLTGWGVVSATPAQLTASASGTASSTVIMKHKGTEYIWNKTEDINTDDFFDITANNKSNPTTVTFEGMELTAAIKMESSTVITFEAPAAGTLLMVLDKESVNIKINGTKTAITSGVPFEVPEGTVTITKGDSVNIYYMRYTADETSSEIESDTLSDDVMWDVTTDFAPEGSNGLIAGVTFGANSEEDGAVEFVEGDKIYRLSDYLQSTANPTAEDGYNPGNAGNTGIPVAGGFLKFTAPADGAFTAAIKTNAGKVTYVNNEDGSNIIQIGEANVSATSYDVVRFNVTEGKSYYIFSGGSNICIYYLGYTAGKTVDESTTEATTEASTETSTEASTETTTDTTPDPTPDPTPVYGDANGDGIVDASDVALVVQHILKGSALGNTDEYVDVNKDGKIDSEDAAMILQYALNSSYTLPR